MTRAEVASIVLWFNVALTGLIHGLHVFSSLASLRKAVCASNMDHGSHGEIEAWAVVSPLGSVVVNVKRCPVPAGFREVRLVPYSRTAEQVLKVAAKLVGATRGKLGFLDVPGRIDALVTAVEAHLKAKKEKT